MNTALHILRECRTIAVVGLSPKPERDSYRVSAYMQAQGYRIIPVHPLATTVLGETAYPSLQAAAAVERIDLVNCFRRAEDIPPIAADAVRIGAKALWLQLGIVNDAALRSVRAQGLLAVQDLCIKVEHARALRAGTAI